MPRTILRAARAAVCLLALAALAGCGDRNLVIDVDVLSYLDADLTNITFGPIPAVPGGLASGEVTIFKDVIVNLLEKPSNFASVQNVSLTMEATVFDSTGAGQDTVRLYMSDPATDPLTTVPVAVLAVDLQPGQTTKTEVAIDGDSRVVSLFDGSQMRMCVTTSVRGPASGDDLNGRLTLSKLRALLIANRKGT
jgi:hypothetical protein